MMNFLQEALRFNPLQADTYSIFGIILFLLLLVWSFIWKGMALWRAARSEHKKWFIVLLIVNTFGILELLYLFVFSKRIKTAKPNTETEGL